MEIGDRIKSLRLQYGLTLEELGNLCGVGKSTVRKWEKGMIEGIKQTNLAKLAKALNTTPEDLMGWNQLEEQIIKEIPIMEQICCYYGNEAGQLISIFSQLETAEKDKAIDLLQNLLDAQKYRTSGKEDEE